MAEERSNRPRGREKNITGQGKDVYKRGDGLGTGPVGDTSGRPQSGGNRERGTSSGDGTTRAGGKSLLPVIIILAVVLLGGGGGLGSLLGLFTGTDTSGLLTDVTTTQTQTQTQTIISGSTASSGGTTGSSSYDISGLSSLFGSLGGGSVSTGWTKTANTEKLDNTVASGARAKRTNIIGGGKDTVTIMVYMCGTDLESRSGMATNDLNEMMSASIASNVNIIVYTGGCKSWRTNGISNTVNQIYKVESGKMIRLVENDGSSAMTSPANLSKFIQYCAKNYPANRNELIFWDHGGGSLSGYGYDEKNASSGSMTLKGINEALKSGGVTFDFIGFDACLMATAENALMLTDYADYLIASEETEPGIGWYYTDWLNALSKNTSMSTLEIGKNICDSFVAECNRRCAGQKTTLSVVDLAELEATLPKELRSFSSSASELIDEKKYDVVSNARTSCREFASSSQIDQVDLVHLCYNMGTEEGEALADAVLGAVKYNVTSSNMTNAYGLSIYFPYQKASKVNTAVATYEAIGMDSEYMDCIRKFASVEQSGQSVAGGMQSPLTSLLGGSSGSSAVSSDMIFSLLGSMLSAGTVDKSIDLESLSDYLAENRFDADALKWKDGVITLSSDQWSLINDLELNVFYDDGEGFIDLGLDFTTDCLTDEGAINGAYDGTWLAINGQPVPYYHVDTVDYGDSYSITGRVPVLLNGERADLIIVFDDEHPYGYVAGARTDYKSGETDTIAKGMTELNSGDVIDFVCDYYTYDGVYSDSYLYGEAITVNGELTISNVYLPHAENAMATYRLTDIYGEVYWTEVIG